MMNEDLSLEDDFSSSCSTRRDVTTRLADIRNRAQSKATESPVNPDVNPTNIKQAIDDLETQYYCSTISKGEKIKSLRDSFSDIRRIISIQADELIRRVMADELELLNKMEAMNFEVDEIEQKTVSFHEKIAAGLFELTNSLADLSQEYDSEKNDSSDSRSTARRQFELLSLFEDITQLRDEFEAFKKDFDQRVEKCRFEFSARKYSKNESLLAEIPEVQPELLPTTLEPPTEGPLPIPETVDPLPYAPSMPREAPVEQPDEIPARPRGESFRPINAVCDFLDQAFHVEVDQQKREDMEQGFREWYLSVDNGFWKTASVFGIPRP